LISEGNTKGVFQLESRLGQSMAKKLKPENIEQLSALISIMRPGCLEAIRDGKSVSNHFIDKKNGLESVDYFNENLEPILKNTYGEMVYQEQAMEIAKEIRQIKQAAKDGDVEIVKALTEGKTSPQNWASAKFKS
jgi:DNA polymerase-3 subunit alpha